MTPLGLNTAAVTETAALFPLSAAIPPAAEGSSSNGGAAATAFGDLLAANFAQSEQLQEIVPADLASAGFNTLSLADVWFAGLDVDLNALNASLEVEEAGTRAAAPLAAAIPAVDTHGADEAAPLMELAAAVPAALPLSVPVVIEGSSPETVGSVSEKARVDGSVGAQASVKLAPHANVAADPAIENATIEDSPPGQALSGLPGGPEGLVPQAGDAVAAAQKPVDTGVVTRAPQLADVAQPEVPAPTASVQETSVEELPKDQRLKAFDSVPPAQPTGRTRDSVVARFAEISGLGVSGDAVAKPAPGTSVDADAQSQSQTQDGSAQDAFAFGVKENAAPARSTDGVAVAPVFSVAAPAAGPARAVVVEGATLPPAPPAATVPGPENVGRLIESMRVQMRQGVQEATVRLNPEHLGEVTISVRVDRGAVSAVVNAETPAVQQWLEAQEEKLRSGLSDQGLHLAKFVVHRDGSQQQRDQPQQQKQAARDRQQHDGAPVRFEVIV